MDVTITTRHCSIPDAVRDRMTRRIRKIDRFERRATAAHISFEADRRMRRVEARVDLAGGPPIVAHADGPTFRNALDRAIDRLERQIKRRRDRRRRRRNGVGGIDSFAGQDAR
jgi:putative sigma-54 modulation protein